MKRFIMTENALENYGEEYRDVVLIPVHTANKWMNSEEFYAKNMPKGYHPGYDKSMNRMNLYDLRIEKTDEMLPFSLYTYELEVYHG